MGAFQNYCGCNEKSNEVILFQEKNNISFVKILSNRNNNNNNNNSNNIMEKEESKNNLFTKDELKKLDNSLCKIQKKWKAAKFKDNFNHNRKSIEKFKNKKEYILSRYLNIVNLININIEKHGEFILNQNFLNKMPEKIFRTFSKFYQKEPLNMSFSPLNTYRIKRNSIFIYKEKYIYKGQWTPQGERDGFGVLLGNDFLVQGFWNSNNLYYGMKIYFNGDYFIGQLRNYSANGDGKFFKENDEVIYSGDFKNDMFHGIGKLKLNYNSNYNDIFTNMQNSVKPENGFNNAVGVEDSKKKKELENTTYNKNNDDFTDEKMFYKGEFEENTINGKGKLFIKNYIKYEGDFSEGKFHGNGKLVFLNNKINVKQFLANNFCEKNFNFNISQRQTFNNTNSDNNNNDLYKISDKNKRITNIESTPYENLNINSSSRKKKISTKNDSSLSKIEYDEYTGDFINNAYFGRGIYIWKTGEYFEGTFFENKKEGWGTISFTDGVNFETCWSDDLPGEEFIVSDENGNILSNDFYKFSLVDLKGKNMNGNKIHFDNNSGNIINKINNYIYYEKKKAVLPEYSYYYPNKNF